MTAWSNQLKGNTESRLSCLACNYFDSILAKGDNTWYHKVKSMCIIYVHKQTRYTHFPKDLWCKMSPIPTPSVPAVQSISATEESLERVLHLTMHLGEHKQTKIRPGGNMEVISH
jgi:hypothetical protein